MTGLLFAAVTGHGPPAVAQAFERIAFAGSADDVAAIGRSLLIYGHGTFAQIFGQRLRDLGTLYQIGLFSMPTIFAMFLLGLWAGRRGIFNDLAAARPVFKSAALWGLLIGGACSFAAVLGHDRSGGTLWVDFVSDAVQLLAAPVLTCGYVAAVALLMTAGSWASRAGPLASVGRMALTNYLSQSLICTTLFYGYGLGLYGQIGLAQGLGLACIIYTAQVVWSTWWMRRFSYGPVEWVWRALTYGRRPLHAAEGRTDG
jgi:uncharacterized protein